MLASSPFQLFFNKIHFTEHIEEFETLEAFSSVKTS